MIITVHVNGYYNWEPVPADVDKTSDDFKKAIEKKLVKPDFAGTWLMRVSKKGDTETFVALSELELINIILQEMCRGDKQPMTRAQCAARYLSRHVMHNEAHKNWMEAFEVNDDVGPDEALFSRVVAEHVACGNISEDDAPDLLEAYLTPIANDEHVEHLHAHFGVKPEARARGQAKLDSKGARQ